MAATRHARAENVYTRGTKMADSDKIYMLGLTVKLYIEMVCGIIITIVFSISFPKLRPRLKQNKETSGELWIKWNEKPGNEMCTLGLSLTNQNLIFLEWKINSCNV